MAIRASVLQLSMTAEVRSSVADKMVPHCLPCDSNSKSNSNSNSISTGKSIMSINSTNRNARVSSLWTLLHAACVPWQN
jgi:hypothetical protein